MVSVCCDRVVQFGSGLRRNGVRRHLYRESLTDIGETDRQRLVSEIGHQNRSALLLSLRQISTLNVHFLESQISETDRIKFPQRELLVVGDASEPQDNRLLQAREICRQGLVERVASPLVILEGSLDGSGLPRSDWLPGPFHIRASAGRYDIIDQQRFVTHILDRERGGHRAVRDQNVPEIVHGLVQLDYSAECVVLARALGGDDTAGGHKQKHRGGNMLEYIHKSRCLIV